MYLHGAASILAAVILIIEVLQFVMVSAVMSGNSL